MKFQQDHLIGSLSNWQGITYHEFIPEGAMVNRERCKECSPDYKK
jgi:hypothetical protein